MSNIASKIPIIADNNFKYTGCASDGESLYFTIDNKNEIHIFDKNYCYDSKVAVENSYFNISYNSNDSSFYLLKDSNIAISSDKNFSSIKDLPIKLSEICTEKIISISYSATNNLIYIVNINQIISVNLNNMKASIITENINRNNNLLNYTAICDYEGVIYIAYNKKHMAYIAKLGNNNTITEEYYIDEDINISNIYVSDGILKLFTSNNFSYIYETNIIENANSRGYHNKGSNSRGFNLNKGYNNYNEYNCSNNDSNMCNCDCHKNNNCNCDCNLKCCDIGQNISDIIESIALEETGISHILNAEGEKIQKILMATDNVCEILKVNESVNKTINNISMLEQILLSKLQVVSDIICSTNKCTCNKCDCDC